MKGVSRLQKKRIKYKKGEKQSSSDRKKSVKKEAMGGRRGRLLGEGEAQRLGEIHVRKEPQRLGNWLRGGGGLLVENIWEKRATWVFRIKKKKGRGKGGFPIEGDFADWRKLGSWRGGGSCRWVNEVNTIMREGNITKESIDHCFFQKLQGHLWALA